MADYQLGEIVLIKFPFTNNTQFKKRPALIISDTNDGDVIVCRITSKSYKTLYDLELKSWEDNGLQIPSYIRVHKIASLEKVMIDKILGKVENPVISEVIRLAHQLFQS